MILLMSGSIFLSNASVYKGQMAYMKMCKSCHSDCGKLVTSHTQAEWKRFFNDDAKVLKTLHAKDPKAMKMLDSKKFEKRLKHMRQFFSEFGNDTGNVPACN